MKFVMEFAENLILRMMEDPKKRDETQRQRLYAVAEQCEKVKAYWALPLRPFGHWNFEHFNSQLRWDAHISQVPGRRDPYDDLLAYETSDLPPSSSTSK
ncbi:uncharacterized protein LOC141820332 [Curcuma longa]|uniref:uncharacterized protein LOC141820332 n=1 Tax=Curcuma longa TaxID=136217 RepID=UPI003D9F22C3